MAEEVKLYSPWSSSCSCKIDFVVQPLLEEIREGRISTSNVSSTVRVVLWKVPPLLWVKVNTDGLSKGSPGLSACGGVFRSNSGEFLGGFLINLGFEFAYYAELMAVLIAIEIAYSKGWWQLWIESDALTVVQVIQTRWLDPRHRLIDRWIECLRLMNSMIIDCSHIYREENRVADALANLGLEYSDCQWWDFPLREIHVLLSHDFLGIPYYRCS
ncbi:hypothetical protein Pint_36567 [Pistacia integerrima]|uniref:Uncharacterized protein n=1 Tax=Pistacia integerrima TaxID=434235 RepID=A0ACC0Y0I1_9ROSI|nr:hypothetical protein Pint_36567 [Pistacia integerrima]